MSRRRALVALAAAVLVAAAAIASFVLLGGDDPEPRTHPEPIRTPSGSAPSPVRDAGTTGEPSRVRIPAIDVDARVVGVGTTADNGQEVPGSLSVTGWWRDGVQPGAPGNAVLVGHTASIDDGVFDDLADTQTGDAVTVKGGAGRVTFRVTEVDAIPVRDFATVADDVYRTDGPRGLVLMTCGDWNGRRFESTVIVHAEAA